MQSQKIIISVAGVILFLLAGAASMFFMPSDTNNISASNQNQIAENTPAVSQTTKPEPAEEKSNASSPKIWYVYVTGSVKKPGVYALPENSRVFKAIEAAGGFKANADETSINLAEFLADSAHIHIPAKTSQPQQSPHNVRIPGLQSQQGTNSSLININTASVQELQRIKGVGPSTAQKIIDYRNSHGAFTKLEDLMNVKGIGRATLEKIRPQITLQGGSYNTHSGISAQPSSNSNLIDINHADLQELQRIKGVGPATAQKIIDYRNSHGAFTKPEDLINVRGIGAAKLKQIRTQIIIR